MFPPSSWLVTRSSASITSGWTAMRRPDGVMTRDAGPAGAVFPFGRCVGGSCGAAAAAGAGVGWAALPAGTAGFVVSPSFSQSLKASIGTGVILLRRWGPFPSLNAAS